MQWVLPAYHCRSCLRFFVFIHDIELFYKKQYELLKDFRNLDTLLVAAKSKHTGHKYLYRCKVGFERLRFLLCETYGCRLYSMGRASCEEAVAGG